MMQSTQSEGAGLVSTDPAEKQSAHTGGRTEEIFPTNPLVKGNIIVYLTGQVKTPGVISLPEGARVSDAITRCGGNLPEADMNTINLARPLLDGEHIIVWKQGETPPDLKTDVVDTQDIGVATSPNKTIKKGSGKQGCVNLNTADATQLETLDGVGPKLAQRILDYREKVGVIRSVEDLQEVSGIGSKLLSRVRSGVCG